MSQSRLRTELVLTPTLKFGLMLIDGEKLQEGNSFVCIRLKAEQLSTSDAWSQVIFPPMNTDAS